MIKDYNNVLEALEGISAHLLQVAVYTTVSPQCIIILDADPANLLDSLQSLRDYVNKRRLPFPLLVNKEFVLSSLDSFPLEFLDIVSANYTNLLAKEDVLKQCSFSASDLRLQMEREVKSKWLLTRLTVLENPPKPKDLAQILFTSIISMLPVLKGFCHLNDQEIPTGLEALINLATQITQIDLSFLMHWLTLDKADTFIMKNYLGILQSLIVLLENAD